MIPISQLRKLRLRELVYLTLNHKTNKKQSQNETQICISPEYLYLNSALFY